MKAGGTKSYKNLIVWQRAMELAQELYNLSRLLPHTEMFGLAAQLRRGAVSIPSNIAEGNGRRRVGDYIRFLLLARGASQEIETQLLIAKNLNYLSESAMAPAARLNDEIGRMLSTMARGLARHRQRMDQ